MFVVLRCVVCGLYCVFYFFFFKQKTAYDMRISDWSSDVCSSHLGVVRDLARIFGAFSNPEFDYLPTLSIRRGDAAALLLNKAPSFQKPKSVLVVGMPAIEADSPPRLRSAANGPICAARPGVEIGRAHV